MHDRERTEQLGIRSDPEQFRVARRWLSAHLTAAGWFGEEIRDLTVALSEACSNAHRYGYEGRTDGRIDLELTLGAERAELRVRDYGRGFDSRQYQPPDLSRPREGGYGIQLMRGLTDGVEHRLMDRGTLVLMTKLRRSPVGCCVAAERQARGKE